MPWLIENLPRRTSSEKTCNKNVNNAFSIMPMIQNTTNINVEVLHWFVKFFHKNSNGDDVTYQSKPAIESETSINQQAEELYKLINRECK